MGFWTISLVWGQLFFTAFKVVIQLGMSKILKGGISLKWWEVRSLSHCEANSFSELANCKYILMFLLSFMESFATR